MDQQVDNIKMPPNSVDAERSVLGGLMLDNRAFEIVSERLMAADFFRHQHRQIYSVICKLSEEEKPFDVLTLSDELQDIEALAEIGGLEYLSELVESTPSAANISAYADIVKEKALLRRLAEAATDIADTAYNTQGNDPLDLISDAEKRIAEVAEGGTKKDAGPEHVNPIMSRTLEKIEELFQMEDGLTGLTTGFTDLDKRTNGFQTADLIIVAGRPSMGKTTFAMNLCENALLHANRPVLVFSMEMPKEAILMRMYSSVGRIPSNKLRSGKLDEEDWPKLTSAFNLLKDKPLYIDDTAALTPQEMRARCRRVYRENNNDLALVMVDYLQLMQVAGKSEGRTQEISEISRSLKAIAKEFGCPVVALSQLNRSLEQRPNKRPVMSDLRESGAIEQDADIIAFIYRDEVYNEDSPDKGIGEIIIGKHRNGEIGTDRLAFIGKYTRFENLAPGFYENREMDE
ncbi:replicative DNA helicase [Bermanella sp. R86510]|uniref:replicative DNA helicase n=1 Tax=unclassified Bermanella TaxID=2627862 RepID=UPI0037C6C4D7